MMKSGHSFDQLLTVIGGHLAELRLKKGFSSIKEFAQHYDLPEIQYWRIEKGKANVTLKSLVRVLQIHNITLPDFFCVVTEVGSAR